MRLEQRNMQHGFYNLTTSVAATLTTSLRSKPTLLHLMRVSCLGYSISADAEGLAAFHLGLGNLQPAEEHASASSMSP